jgi:thiamine pyrophosphate-dependent acetolactate synthase large subunit-like protein
VTRAFTRARDERRTVVLNLPLDVQAAACAVAEWPAAPPRRAGPADELSCALAELLARAERPVFIAGRGARHAERSSRARRPVRRPARDVCRGEGALPRQPLVARRRGRFRVAAGGGAHRGRRRGRGVRVRAEHVDHRHGRLVSASARVAQVDVRRRRDRRSPPRSTSAVVGERRSGRRGRFAETLPSDGRAVTATKALRERIRARRRWRDVTYDDDRRRPVFSTRGRSPSRWMTCLPRERVVAVDSGNFMGYPSMFLSVPDERGFCFTQAFQSIGLGLATAIGAALAQPHRLPVAALGDGGFAMSIAELDTGGAARAADGDRRLRRRGVRRGGPPLRPGRHPLDIVRFPETDFAAIGRGFGCAGVTVRAVDDLEAVRKWLDGPRDRPLVIDAKVTRDKASWWLEEAFRGH